MAVGHQLERPRTLVGRETVLLDDINTGSDVSGKAARLLSQSRTWLKGTKDKLSRIYLILD